MNTFERIKEISKERGLNLKKTAIEAGLSENAIYKWKTQTPQSNALQAVADVLGVSVDYLLGNTDEMHAAKKSTSTDELFAAHWGIDLSKLSQEDKAIVMSRARDYVKGMVDALESK